MPIRDFYKRTNHDEDPIPSMSVITITKTIITSILPSQSAGVSRTSGMSGVSISKSEMSSEPILTATPNVSVASSIEAVAVVTIVVTSDDRCPYPYPGVYCGEPLTTLVTKTKFDMPGMTEESKSVTRWCPYPGQKC
jgi:hypothetical protein